MSSGEAQERTRAGRWPKKSTPGNKRLRRLPASVTDWLSLGTRPSRGQLPTKWNSKCETGRWQ